MGYVDSMAKVKSSIIVFCLIGVLLLAVGYLFFANYRLIKISDNLITQINELKDKANKDNPDQESIENKIKRVNKYASEIMQIGGAGSRVAQATIWNLEDQEYFSPNENWVSYGFNSPADILWISCRDNYELVSCEAYGEKQEIMDEGKNCAVAMRTNTPQNRVYIECNKK